jgi:YD repeat-containing protein
MFVEDLKPVEVPPASRVIGEAEANAGDVRVPVSWVPNAAVDEEGRLLGRWQAVLHDGAVVDFTNGRMTRYERLRGGVLVYERDDAGRLTRVAWEGGPGWSFGYDAATGVANAITDDVGRKTVLEVAPPGQDGTPRLLSIMDPTGVVTTLDYDEEGRLVRQETPGRAVETVIRDPAGRVVEVRYDDADPMSFEPADREGTVFFDRQGVPVVGGASAAGAVRTGASTDAAGRRREIDFDTGGSEVAYRDGEGREWALTNDRGLPGVVIDPEGLVTRHTYNNRGLVTQVELAETVNGSPLSVFKIERNGPFGAPTRITGPAGVLMEAAYDTRRPTKIWEAQPGVVDPWIFTYDTKGRMASLKQPSGAVLTVSRNVAGQEVSVADPVGTWKRSPDAAGRTVGTSSPEGVTWVVTRDGLGRWTSARDGSAATWHSLGYQPQNDCSGCGTEDELGLGLGVQDPSGASWPVARDGRGRAEELAMPNGGAITLERDPAGEVVGVVDADGRHTGLSRDDRALVTAEARPDGREMGYVYDDRGQLVRLRLAGAGEIELKRDLRGRVIALIEADGTRTDYQYDGLDRLSSVTEVAITFYTYGLNQLLEKVKDVHGTLTLAWDKALRPTSRAWSDGEKIAYTYGDPRGLLTTMVHHGLATSYGYDADARLTSWNDAEAGQQCTVTYDSVRGLPSKLACTPGGAIGYGFDARSLLTHYAGGAQHGDVSLSRDSEGLVSKVTVSVPGALAARTLAGSRTVAGLLTAVTLLGSGTGWSATLDPLGRPSAVGAVFGAAKGTLDRHIVRDTNDQLAAVLQVVDALGWQQLPMNPAMVELPSASALAFLSLPRLAALRARPGPIRRGRLVGVGRAAPHLLAECRQLAFELADSRIPRRQLHLELDDQLARARQLSLELSNPALRVHREA